MTTDLDGTPLVILSEEEALAVYYLLRSKRWYKLSYMQRKVAQKISKTLAMPPLGDEL